MTRTAPQTKEAANKLQRNRFRAMHREIARLRKGETTLVKARRKAELCYDIMNDAHMMCDPRHTALCDEISAAINSLHDAAQEGRNLRTQQRVLELARLSNELRQADCDQYKRELAEARRRRCDYLNAMK